MTLTPFQSMKLTEWAEHVLTNGERYEDMPRGVQEVARWASATSAGIVQPFPQFDTLQPYTFGE